MKNLNKKTALVIEATTGTGQAIAIGLAMVGCEVIIHGGRPEDLQDTEGILRSCGGKVHKVTSDLGNPLSLQIMLEELDRNYPVVDVVYNRAEIRPSEGLTAYPDYGIIEEAMEVNVHPLITICNHFAARMLEKGAGRIVNFTAGSPQQNILGADAICGAAIESLTRELGRSLEGTDVYVDLMTPAWILTALEGLKRCVRAEENGTHTGAA